MKQFSLPKSALQEKNTLEKIKIGRKSCYIENHSGAEISKGADLQLS